MGKTKGFGLLLLGITAIAQPGFADQVIADDVIVDGSLCVGTTCADGEDFGFDTIRIKADSPQFLFDDTSISSSFPNQDWLMGTGDDSVAAGATFFVRNVTNALNVLQLAPEGHVAIGAGSELVAGAISVGSLGNERRVTHAAAAVDDHDAVTLGQANALIDDEVADIQASIADLNARLDAILLEIAP